MKTTIEKLDNYCKIAADSIREPLSKGDVEWYKKFIDLMYHYTVKSGDKLKSVSDNSPNQELRDYFDHMFLEERNDYMLAKQDLKAYGLVPSAESPQVIKNIDKLWEMVSQKHINFYLGMVYVLENIADKVADEVRGLVKRLELTKSNARWLLIHAEADIEHGAQIKDMLEKYLSQNVEAAIEGAKEACDKWVAIAKHA